MVCFYSPLYISGFMYVNNMYLHMSTSVHTSLSLSIYLHTNFFVHMCHLQLYIYAQTCILE